MVVGYCSYLSAVFSNELVLFTRFLDVNSPAGNIRGRQKKMLNEQKQRTYPMTEFFHFNVVDQKPDREKNPRLFIGTCRSSKVKNTDAADANRGEMHVSNTWLLLFLIG